MMTPAVSNISSDFPRLTALFVWGVLVVMLGIALAQIARFGHNVPFAEDWTVTPFAHGSEPLTFDWLWSQNNEHRLPLGRLVLVALFKGTGDYRAGMYFNAVLLASLAFAMVRTAAALRGHIALTDAFFPLAFLNWGEAENLGWSWQVTFVTSSLFACLLLVVIARQKTNSISVPDAVLAGFCLVALPLTGGAGLVYVPALATWAAISAFVLWRGNGARGRRSAAILATAVLLVGVISALYFVDYQNAYWNPPSPSLLSTIRTTGAVLALSIGPAARLWWSVSAGMVVLLLVATAWLIGRRVLVTDEARIRLLGMLCYGAALAGLAVAIGHSRAGLVRLYGVPIRYSLLALPVLCWAYYAWQLYGPEGRRWALTALFAGTALLVPINHHIGMQWTNYYANGMEAFERDVRAGVPGFVLCNQYQNFLMHWDGESICKGLRMLERAGVGIFSKIAPDPDTTEIPGVSSPSGEPRWVYAIRVYLTTAAATKGDWLDVSWGRGSHRIHLDEVNPSEQNSYLVWVNGVAGNIEFHSNREPATLHVARAALLVPRRN